MLKVLYREASKNRKKYWTNCEMLSAGRVWIKKHMNGGS